MSAGQENSGCLVGRLVGGGCGSREINECGSGDFGCENQPDCVWGLQLPRGAEGGAEAGASTLPVAKVGGGGGGLPSLAGSVQASCNRNQSHLWACTVVWWVRGGLAWLRGF